MGDWGLNRDTVTVTTVYLRSSGRICGDDVVVTWVTQCWGRWPCRRDAGNEWRGPPCSGALQPPDTPALGHVGVTRGV